MRSLTELYIALTQLRCWVRLDVTSRLPLPKLKMGKIYKRNRNCKGRNDGHFTVNRLLRRNYSG